MAAEARVSRWYFGGLASCGAACCTHPLDLLKVHLQTQQEVKLRMTGMALRVVRTDGILALYNGLSASLCRQMTYSLTRFAIYETVRDRVAKGSQGPLPFHQKVLLGSVSGLAGGFVGTPADLVNVRMQNDVKLPQGQRRKVVSAEANAPGMERAHATETPEGGAASLPSSGQLCPPATAWGLSRARGPLQLQCEPLPPPLPRTPGEFWLLAVRTDCVPPGPRGLTGRRPAC
ncbi:mitochondrial dicarboxylate carrier isoform X4 [Pan paniscus]|uniref:mitochondrial dicarboxylate carrier isoform X4 n=1 Tax=Pan paniscus TaxID=9597 RepID=UPI0030048064